MDRTFSRIQHTTEELDVVRDELNRRAAREGSGLPAALVDDESADVLIAFKQAVDEIRQFLWHYLNEIVSQSDTGAGYRLGEEQMRRVAQLLVVLKKQ
jgi:hypothetical protein